MERINRKNVRIDGLSFKALVCHELGDEEAALKHLLLIWQFFRRRRWMFF